MTPAARIAAAAQLLDQIAGGESAEKVLTNWARRSRFAGSGDRAALRDLVFDALRRRRSLAARGGGEGGRALMIGLLREAGEDPEALFTGEGHAPAPLSPQERGAGRAPAPGGEALDLPDWLLPAWLASLDDTAETVARILRDRAPVTLRVNLAKTDVDHALAELREGGLEAERTPGVATALRLGEGARRLRGHAAYREGRVELQDAASQALVAALPLEGRTQVLDYCAGGGGKTLAMAALHPGARYTACDAEVRRMADLPERAARAGVEVALLDDPGDARPGGYDLVLCDAPCSGSGAWRRSPEAKWNFTPQRLGELVEIQFDILERAAPLVARDGYLCYATCSVLAAENDETIARFLAANPHWRLHVQRRWLPDAWGDGFFLATLTRSD